MCDVPCAICAWPFDCPLLPVSTVQCARHPPLAGRLALAQLQLVEEVTALSLCNSCKHMKFVCSQQKNLKSEDVCGTCVWLPVICVSLCLGLDLCLGLCLGLGRELPTGQLGNVAPIAIAGIWYAGAPHQRHGSHHDCLSKSQSQSIDTAGHFARCATQCRTTKPVQLECWQNI